MASETAPSSSLPNNETDGHGDNSGKDSLGEIAEIKSAYPGRCRVINDSGDYKHIVTVQPENLDATIKFQLRSKLFFISVIFL